MARLEAVLFASAEPLNSRKLAQFASLADGTLARTLVRRLNAVYDAQGCAFRVEEVAGGFQLLTRPRFGVWVRRFRQASGELRLSSPALESLAVIAYRQPVLRAEIEAIRGVQCGEILRQLMERDLVRIIGKSSDLGRPFLYGTSKRFLQVFGMKSLDDLPRADVLCRQASSPNTETHSGCGQDVETTSTSHEQGDLEVKIRSVRESLEDATIASRVASAWPELKVAKSEEEYAEDDLDEDEEDDDDEDEEDDDDDDEEEDDEIEEDDELEEELDEDDEEDDEEDEWEEVDDDDEEWDEEDDEDDDEEDDDDLEDDDEEEEEWEDEE